MREVAFVCIVLAVFVVSCAAPQRNLPCNSRDVLLTDQILELPAGTNYAGDVYVDFNSRGGDYQKLAILPFKSPLEQAGIAVSDFFTTELLKTARYELIERSQMENILKEQELRLSGVIEDKMAAQLGNVLGVQGVVVGNVSEYGVQKVGFSTAPSVGLSIRMIDSTSGKIVWSVSHSLVGKPGTSISQHSKDVVMDMVEALSRAWIDAGDMRAAGIPPPMGACATGLVRKVGLSWTPHTSAMVAGYEILRSESGGEGYVPVIRLKNTRQWQMCYVDANLKDLSLYSYEIRTVSKYGLSSAQAAKVEAITAGIPVAPSNFRAESHKIRQVPLTWSVATDPSVTGYIVIRVNADKAESVVAKLDDRNAVSCVDNGEMRTPLGDGQICVYRIKSFNEANVESEPSMTVTAKTLPAPSKPTGVNAVGGMPQAVVVRWAASPAEEEIAGYVVCRAETAEGNFEEIGRASGTKSLKYVDQNERRHKVENGTTYFYKVAAYNAGEITGAQSETVSATTKPAPAKLEAPVASTGRVKEISLEWSAGVGRDLESYVVYRALRKGGRTSAIGKVPVATRVFVDKGLEDGASYWYQVAVADKDGLESELSDAVEGATKPLPEPPADLACASQAGKVTLSWTKSGSDDVVKYVIYSHGFMRLRKLAETKETTFDVMDLPPGSYKFSVTAVDRDGIEGRRSTMVNGTVGK